jgi:polysaccharide biosynthesis protein PslG
MKPNTDLVPLLTARGYKPVARLRPRHAREIKSSPWSIGCETIDRDYVDFSHTGPHLGELGAKANRVQCGWAKCEPNADGRYEWAWLDRIVDSSIEQGVTPWLQTSYGNPRYEGGGGIGLAEGLPTSPTALAAWDRWVDALVRRYADRVNVWEIWNEPDIHSGMSAAGFAEFHIRTAALIRAAQPDARIVALGLASKLEFVEALLAAIGERRLTHLIDEISYHFYPHNPDDSFDRLDQIRAAIRAHAPHVTLRQGETGAPSETVPFMALGKFEWSERKQAAWNLRRLLAHHSRGIPMSLFQLADMQYTKAGGAKFEGRNSKGQLCINPDKTVAYRKPSYFMAQHVFSLFDDAFPLAELPNRAAGEAIRTTAHAWTRRDDTQPSLLAWWRCDDAPALAEPSMDHVALAPITLRDAVLIDFLSGTVFAPAGDVRWSELPRTDVPLALAERSILPLRELA